MSDSSFGGDGIPQDQSGNKSGGGGGFPFGMGNQGDQSNLMNAMNMDPTSLAGGYGDPLYQAQLATTPTNAPTDPQTGAAVSPGTGQPSGQGGGWVSQLVSALNPFSMSGAQARAPQPAAPGQPPAAPGWMQPNQGQMFTQGGDPSTWGGSSAAAGSYGTPPPARRQNAPAAAPGPPARPSGGGRAPQQPAIDPSTLADVSTTGGGQAAPAAAPFTYDPSQDPFAAATGMTAPAGGGTGNLPTSTILGPSSAEAALPPRDESRPPASPTDPSGVSGAQQGAGAPSQAPAPDTGDPLTPPSAAPTAGQQPSGGGQAGQPQINPMRLLTDLLFGGPQALMQDLMSMAGQAQGMQGQQPQQGQGGQQGGAAAPWLAQGQRAPRGTRPQDYPQATPEQVRAIQQRQAVPGIDTQGRPQARDAQQPNQPRPVTTQRVTPSSGSPSLPGATPSSATLPSTGSGNLDPFTRAAAGGLPTGATPQERSVRARTDPLSMGSTAAQPDGTPQPDARAAAAGQPTNAPQQIIAGARQAVMQGGPGAVARWMAHNGHPRSGPWCGEFAAAVMQSQGLPVPRNPEVASNWRTWGNPTSRPQPGDVAVARTNYKTGRYVPTGSTGGHVTTVIAVHGDTMTVIGGNQGRMQTTRPIRGYDFRTLRQQNNLAQIRAAQASGRQGLVQAIPGQSPASPAEQLANEAYARRMAQGAYPNFRRSANIEDRRRDAPTSNLARSLPSSDNGSPLSLGPRAGYTPYPDPNDPMARALGLNDLSPRGPRRTAGQ